MKITVNSQTLAHEIRLLNKIAATKPTIPILGHVLIRAEETLRLFATDMEVAMGSTCDANIVEAGWITLPVKPLLDILEQLPDADVHISDGNVSSGGFRSRLSSLPVQDFPTMPEAPAELAVLSAQSLNALIERTFYAISDKEQKYVLKGGLFSLTAGVMAMVTTDGKRLSIATATRGPGEDASVIIPGKTLRSIQDQVPTGNVSFTRSATHLFFNYGRRLLVSRTIDGEYPKYQRIIPKGNTDVLRVDRGALAATLRRVGLVAETISMRFAPGVLELASRSQEIGDADETLAVHYDGPEVRVRVNWKYIHDFLERSTESVTSIAVKDDKTPILLTDGADFINVVMIMRES